jgi:hypothetical protein
MGSYSKALDTSFIQEISSGLILTLYHFILSPQEDGNRANFSQPISQVTADKAGAAGDETSSEFSI